MLRQHIGTAQRDLSARSRLAAARFGIHLSGERQAPRRRLTAEPSDFQASDFEPIESENRMWGFAADNAAGGLCRAYASALGHFPAACLTRSGIPALAMTAIFLLAAFVLMRVLRSAWHQR